MADHDPGSVEQEARYHRYTGNAIPWYVHLLWVLFWCFSMYYIGSYLLPALKSELAAPP